MACHTNEGADPVSVGQGKEEEEQEQEQGGFLVSWTDLCLPYAASLRAEAAGLRTRLRRLVQQAQEEQEGQGDSTHTHTNTSTDTVAFCMDYWKAAHAAQLVASYSGLHYKFNREERGELCRFFYQATFAPELDANSCVMFAKLAMDILGNPWKLPEDMVLDWRPAFDFLEENILVPNRLEGISERPAVKTRTNAIAGLVYSAKRFFAKGSAKTIMHRIRPWIASPSDFQTTFAIVFMCGFLPESDPEGFEEICDELMDLWTWRGHDTFWDAHFIALLNRYADFWGDRIKWDPYIPTIYTKLIALLDLDVGSYENNTQTIAPTGTAQIFITLEKAGEMAMMNGASLLIHMLSPSCESAWTHLSRLIHSIDRFFEPEQEQFESQLMSLLGGLCSTFTERLKEEPRGRTLKKPANFLGESERQRFLELVLPLSLKAMYSEHPIMRAFAQLSMKLLAQLNPQYVFPRFLEKCEGALGNVMESYRISAVLSAWWISYRPLLTGAGSGTRLLTVLPHLPGCLVPHEPERAEIAFSLTAGILMCIPVLPYDTSHPDFLELPSAERDALTTIGANWEEWASSMFDACLNYVVNLPVEEEDGGMVLDVDVQRTLMLLLQQIPDSWADSFIRRAFDFFISAVNTSILPLVASFFGCISTGRPGLLLDLVMEHAYGTLIRSGTESLEARSPGLSRSPGFQRGEVHYGLHSLADSEIQWNMTLLGECVEKAHEKILLHYDDIKDIIAITMASTSPAVYKQGLSLLQKTLNGLTSFVASDYRSAPPDVWHSEDFQRASWKYWSVLYECQEAAPELVLMTQEMAVFAQELTCLYTDNCLTEMEEFLAEIDEAEDAPPKERKKMLLSHLKVIRKIFESSGIVIPEIPQEHGYRSRFPRWCPPVIPEVDRERLMHSDDPRIEEQLISLRARVSNVLSDLHSKLRAACDDDLKLWKESCKLAGCVVSNAELGTPIFDVLADMQKSLQYHGLVPKNKFLRHDVVFRLVGRHANRLSTHGENITTFNEHYRNLLELCFSLSTHDFASVRGVALATLEQMFEIFPDQIRLKFIPKFFGILAARDSNEGDLEGATNMLTLSMRYVFEDWKLLLEFCISMLHSTHIEKHSIQENVNSLLTFLFYLPDLPLSYILGGKDMAGAALSEFSKKQAQLKWEDFIHFLLDIVDPDSSSNFLRRTQSDITLQSLMMALEEDGQDLPVGHWKFQMIMLSVLTGMLRLDLPPPKRLVVYIVKQLCNEHVVIRQLAMSATSQLFIHFKMPRTVVYQPRPDTHELFYDLQVAEIANQPTTAEEWAQCYFKEKSSVGFYTLPDFQKTYNYSEESYKKAFESREGKALLKRTEDVAKELSELLESPLMDKKSMIKLLQSLNLSSPPPGEEEEGEEEEESAEGDDAKVNEEDIKKLLERMGSVSSLGAPGRVPVLGVSEAEAMEEDAEIVRSSKPSAGLLSLPTANSKGTKAGGSVSGSSFGGTSLDVLASSSAPSEEEEIEVEDMDEEAEDEEGQEGEVVEIGEDELMALLAGGAGGEGGEEQAAALMAILQSQMGKPFLRGLIDLMAVEEDTQDVSFDQSNSFFWNGLFQIIGMDLWEMLEPILEELKPLAGDGVPEEAGYMNVVAEILSGVLRGSKHLPFEQQQELFASCQDLLRFFVSKSSYMTTTFWSMCVYVCTMDRDPRRVRWMFDFLLEDLVTCLDNPHSTSSQTLRAFSLISQAVAQIAWRAPDMNYAFLEVLSNHLALEHLNLRACVAESIYIVFENQWKPSFARETQRLSFELSGNEINPTLMQFVEAWRDDIIQLDVHSAVASEAIKVLSRRQEASSASTPSLDGVEASNEAIQVAITRINSLKTLLQFMVYCTRSAHYRGFYPYIVSVLPALFKAHALEDEDSRGLAYALYGHIAHAIFPGKADAPSTDLVFGDYHAGSNLSNEIVSYLCKRLSGGMTWANQLATMQALQSFVYKNRFMINPPVWETFFSTIVICMSDPNLDVREIASDTFSGYVPLLVALGDLEKHLVVFEKLAKTPLPRLPGSKRYDTQSPEARQAIMQRQSGLLGLASIIRAYPYTIEEFTPRVLLQIAKRVNDPAPIPTTCRGTLQDFWKTHADAWADHKKAFTDEQLDDLTEVMIAPSYYC